MRRVRQIRVGRGRNVVSVTTFASFSSLWLIPRLEAFQRSHADIDIRVSASDKLVGLDEPDLDMALRYCAAEQAPPTALRLFGEMLTPVIGRWLAEQIAQRPGAAAEPPGRPGAPRARRGGGPLAERRVAELAPLAARARASRSCSRGAGSSSTSPTSRCRRRSTGQAVALGALALVAESLASGELIEPFGPAGRIESRNAYWLVPSQAGQSRPEVAEFARWVLAQAELTRNAMEAATRVFKS